MLRSIKMSWLRLFGRSTWSTCSMCHKKFPINVNSKRLLSLGTTYQNTICPFRMYCVATYLGDDNAVAVVLNKKNSVSITISEVQTGGFTLMNGEQIVGSVILFPHTLVSWHVTCAGDITPESFTLLKVLDPKIDILIFGYGSISDYTPKVRQIFTEFCKKLDIKFEALPTQQAVGLFNFLAVEKRYVAAALIPLASMPLRLDKKKTLTIEELEDEEKLEIEQEKAKLLDPKTKIKFIK